MERDQFAVAEREATRLLGPTWLKRIKRRYSTNGEQLTSGVLFWEIGDVLVKSFHATTAS